MKRITLSSIVALSLLGGLIATSNPALARYSDPDTYAQDKLANAEAQLTRLKAQKKAIEKLIKAVKSDLKAAKIRVKAEKMQSKADANRMDASTQIEQTGVAVDLPDLMQHTETDVNAGLLEDVAVDSGYNQEPVFFQEENGGIQNNSDMPSYIK